MANRNYSLEIQRLKLKKQNVMLSHATMELRLAELDDEKNRLSQNFPLYAAELENIDKEITNLEAASKSEKQ